MNVGDRWVVAHPINAGEFGLAALCERIQHVLDPDTPQDRLVQFQVLPTPSLQYGGTQGFIVVAMWELVE